MYAKRCKGKRLQEERNLFYHWENHTAHCVDGNAYGGKLSGAFDQHGRACSQIASNMEHIGGSHFQTRSPTWCAWAMVDQHGRLCSWIRQRGTTYGSGAANFTKAFASNMERLFKIPECIQHGAKDRRGTAEPNPECMQEGSQTPGPR